MNRLIVNADDFGLAPAVNRGIIDAHLAGGVTSTTLMVNAACTEDAVALARAHPALGIGLHFNLTLGAPLSPPGTIASLLDASGTFHARGVLARRLLLGRVQRLHVERELGAQFERIRALGISPSHIDSHQHVHAFPAVFDSIAALCVEHALPMRMPWILRLAGRRVAPGRRLRQALLAPMLSRNARRWRGRVRWNDALGSVFDLGIADGALEGSHYRQLLSAAPPGVFELMVHPVSDAREVEGLTRIGHIGESEWRFLCSGELREIAEGLGLRFGNFRDAFG